MWQTPHLLRPFLRQRRTITFAPRAAEALRALAARAGYGARDLAAPLTHRTHRLAMIAVPLGTQSARRSGSVNLWDKARITAQLARAGLSWLRRDTRYPSPVPENPKFMSPRDAVRLIRDGDVVADVGTRRQPAGLVVYWAIREAFEESGHPAGLTVMNLGGHGGRGSVPGTLEELGVDGLCTPLHHRSLRDVPGDAGARRGRPTASCSAFRRARWRCCSTRWRAASNSLRQRRPASARSSIRASGRARASAASGANSWSTVRGNRLRYRIPTIDVALFNVPAADRRGNLYVKHAR